MIRKVVGIYYSPVGGTEIMRFSAAQLTSDADNEHGAIFFGDGVLAVFRTKVGVA